VLNFTPSRDIQLRPYQADAVQALRDHIAAKRKRLLLVAGTGAGKTLTSAHILNEAARKGSYTLFIVDRVALVDQTSAVFDEYGISHGIVQGNHPRHAPWENVQVVFRADAGPPPPAARPVAHHRGRGALPLQGHP
jgi:DNA repair protein RadD